MSKLAPCPQCKRHVRISESACPFCAAALQGALAARPSVSTRGLSRASIFALGASLAVAGGGLLEGCADEPDHDDDQDEGTAVPVYGAPIQQDAGPGQPATRQDSGTAIAMYGAPVQPDAGRVVPVYGAPVQPLDAGQNEAGPADAAVTDAGKDAGAADAGVTDAGKDASAGWGDGGRVQPVYGAPVPFYGAPVQPNED
jgi:hypothetical protein